MTSTERVDRLETAGRKRQVLKILKIDEQENSCKQSVVMLKLRVGSGVAPDAQINLLPKCRAKMPVVSNSSQFLRFFRFCGTTEQSNIT